MRPLSVLRISSIVTTLIAMAACTTITLPAKRLEVHYVQLETCRAWSDSSNIPFQDPLVIYRITSIANTSAAGTPAAVFSLEKAFYNGTQPHHPDASVLVQGYLPYTFGVTLNQGQTITPPNGGRFVIQLSDEPVDEQTFPQTQFNLVYDTPSDESVIMIRDPSVSQFKSTCPVSSLMTL